MAKINHIHIKGARVHNLKNIDIKIPRDKLVVITGLSGSGKSSLAFDTIYAEGQRRYVESLSTYARQFLGIMNKPDADNIEGLSPAISIEQKTRSRNPRSTVGTITEIYDYLRLLFARIGIQKCYKCHHTITKQSPQQIVDTVLKLEQKSKLYIIAPIIKQKKGEFKSLIADLLKQGFIRARIDGKKTLLTEKIKLNKNYEDWFLEQIDKNISENINEKIIYKGENEELETLIQKHYKLDMFVQKDYHEIKKDSLYNFLWIGRGYPYRWITIMKFDLNDINDSTSHWQNYFKLLKTYMPSVSVSEYYQKKIYDDNGSIFKLQGLYEEDFSDTGGPFFSNIIKLNNNIGMYVSGFVNNPGKSKYFFLKELELIIGNIKIKRKENE